jgi:predicted DNA-binding transcriptional regulator AlpA|tara:strand:- start:761 stop:955 length:195 start_codon:yes stop_codon:yes gene_type:complete
LSKLLKTKELAEMLSVSYQSLRTSRVTGILLGVEAPKHLKMGQTVRYELETVEAWLNKFREAQQ